MAAAGAQGGTGMPDPIHQFEISRIVPFKFFGVDASFTNSSLFMVLALAAVCLPLTGHARPAMVALTGILPGCRSASPRSVQHLFHALEQAIVRSLSC